MDEIRRQIEDLMGEIEAPMEKKNFHDDDVCKLYLCGLCPHELFENTKLYMGPCKNIHSEILRERYLSEREKMKSSYYKYETESLRILQAMVDDCNRRIERNRVRAQLSDSSKLEDENIRILDLEIKEIMKEIDDLGSSGDIDGSLKKMEDLTRLNQQKMKISATKEDVANGMYRQKLHPCEVCAAFLSETDNDQRLNDHFSGKIHAGYLRIRKQTKDLKEWLKNHGNFKEEYNRYGDYRNKRNDYRPNLYKQNFSSENRGYQYIGNCREKKIREHPDIRDNYSSYNFKKDRHYYRSEDYAYRQEETLHSYHRSNHPIESHIKDSKYRYSANRSHPFSNNKIIRESIEKHIDKKNKVQEFESNHPPSDGEIPPESDTSHSLSRSISPIGE